MSHECPHCGLPPTKRPRRIPTHSPYETQLGTNIAFSAHDHERVNIVNLVANAKADIADLNRNIKMLVASLAAAKKQRDETIAFRDAHLALFPPIHQLPPEVLLEIFHLTFEKPYNVFASSWSGPWLLGKVCRRWRQVAWSCTTLWTSFTLTSSVLGDSEKDYRHKVGTQFLLEGALSRSGKSNKFHIRLGGLKKFPVSAFTKNAESWHDASFDGSPEDFEPFLKIRKMPSLVALGLNFTFLFDNIDAFYQLLSSLGKHVPQLRRLALIPRPDNTFSNDIKLSKINFPWRQLTELVIPLEQVDLCQQFLACCPDLEMLRDNRHVSQHGRAEGPSNISELPAVVCHSKLSSIDMSPTLAITLLDYIRCPALTRLSLPCPRANQSDGEVLHRFIQRSECTITTLDLTFNGYERSLISPETSLSASSEITDLKLSFGTEPPKGRLIECLSDRAVVPKLRVLTLTSTKISRFIWETELKDTLLRVLSARYQTSEQSSTTGTNLQVVVIVLGRETYMMPDRFGTGSVYYIEEYTPRPFDQRRLSETLGRDCTIEDLVDADFVEFRKLKERGLDIRLSIWKGRTLIRYV